MTPRPEVGLIVRALRRILVAVLPDDDWSREFIAELDAELCRVMELLGGGGRVALWYARQMLAARTLHFVWMMRRRRMAKRGDVASRGGGSACGRLLGDLWQDARHAWRGTARDPRTAVFTVLTLAVGIGSVTAMYGVAERLFLRGPRHVDAPDELARVFLSFDDAAGPRTSPWIPFRTARALQDQVRSLSGASLYRAEERLARVGRDVAPVRVSEVDHWYFQTLGVTPRAGRFFTEASLGGDGAPVVLSHALATRGFGSPERSVGRSIELEAGSRTVVAVAPEGFAGPHLERIDIWVPLASADAGTKNWWLIGRLPGAAAPSVERARVAVEADAVHRRTDPGRSFGWAREGTVRVAALSTDEAGAASAEASIARLLLGLVVLVLLIACANVVNLVLARVTRRRGDVVVRLALGIGRWRLARLAIVESVLLALVGGLLSVPVAYGGGRLLRGVLLPQVAWGSTSIDLAVLAITAGMALTIGLVLGLLPARWAHSTDLVDGLASDRVPASPGRARAQAVLAGTQIALSAALLMCAGLFMKSFWMLQVTDLGLAADEALAVRLGSLDPDRLAPFSDAEADAYRSSLSTLRALEGAERSAVVVGLPFLQLFGTSVWVPERDSIPELPGGGPFLTAVSGGYFDAVGTPILRGASITGADVTSGAPVVVVSASMAETLWPDEDPVGACVRIGSETSPCARIVGVAADVHRRGYREPPSMQLYIPLGQERGFGGMALVVRPSRDATAVTRRIQTTLAGAHPAIDHVEVTRLDSFLESELRPWRLGAVVLGVTSALALLVSLLGVYGVLSYVVVQRRREIGVRKALGASSNAVRATVMRKALVWGAVGVTCGVVPVLIGSRWLGPLLFETAVADPLVIGAVSAILLGSALIACLLPAVHATRVDPVACLRGDG